MSSDVSFRRVSRVVGALSAALAVGGMSGAASWAIAPDEIDPRKIMDAVDGRDLGDRSKGRFTMTIQEGGGERSRTVSIQALNVDGARKTMLFFEEPAELHNTALLTSDWDDGAKEDDQWLFMPALAKSTRITGAGKSGSFLGSDLSFADMARSNSADFDYSLVKPSVDVANEDTWLIEATPRTDRTRNETGYSKAHLWISKSKLIPLQVQTWLKDGKRTKRVKAFDVRQIDGVWTPFRIVIRTEKGEKLLSQTELRWLSLAHNQPGVVAEDFSMGRLEKGP